MRYILWVMALMEACDVTSNGRHLGRHLGFYQGRNREKQRNGDFFVLYMKKNHINKHFV